MKTDKVGDHNEAREALVLSAAGATAIAVIANLVMVIVY
jgi:hypothetical protein